MSSAPSEGTGTRERILQAVIASLEEGAEDVVNVVAVARRAGVSRQAVYLHFPNRATLAVAAARWLDEREELESLTAPLRAAQSPEELLRAYAAFYGVFNARIATVARMIYRLRSLPELEEAWQDRLAERRNGARFAARRLAECGRLRAPFTEDSAADWIAAMGSVLVWVELVQDMGWSASAYVDHLHASFVSTLLSDQPRIAR